MKKFGKIMLWILVGLIVIMGASSVAGPTSANIHLEAEINASTDEVWTVLAHQFDEIGDWSPNIERSRAISLDEVPAGFTVASDAPVPGRVTPNPLGDLTEVLIRYSEDEKTFAFDTAGLPAIVTHSINTTQVTELDNGGSLVTFDIDIGLTRPFNVLVPVIQRRFQTSVAGPAGMIQDLKAYVESEQASR